MSFFSSIKAFLLSLFTKMSDFLMMMIIWVAGEMGLLALSRVLSLGVMTQEILFFGASALFIFLLDRYRTNITGTIRGLATKILA